MTAEDGFCKIRFAMFNPITIPVPISMMPMPTDINIFSVICFYLGILVWERMNRKLGLFVVV